MCLDLIPFCERNRVYINSQVGVSIPYLRGCSVAKYLSKSFHVRITTMDHQLSFSILPCNDIGGNFIAEIVEESLVVVGRMSWSVWEWAFHKYFGYGGQIGHPGGLPLWRPQDSVRRCFKQLQAHRCERITSLRRSVVHAKLRDELWQDKESPLHYVPRKYQTFLKQRLSLNSGGGSSSNWDSWVTNFPAAKA